MSHKHMELRTTSELIHISVVTPVYGRQLDLPTLVRRLMQALQKITEQFEIIMVNDASPDNAWVVIKELAAQNDRVRGINLSRNFGQHNAITAGLDASRGDWIVVMDCDLQDQPEEIELLYREAQKGFHMVFGQRFERKDSFFKKLTSRLFYSVLNYLTDMRHDSSLASFGIYSRKAIAAMTQYREQFRSFGMLMNLVGFSRTAIPINHSHREVGVSSYNFRKRINLALDTILANSDKPLRLSIKFGFIMSLSSLGVAAWLVLRFFVQGVSVTGWTSMIVSLYLLSGILMTNMGFLGLYISKVFNEVKRRPLYLVQETTFENVNSHNK